MSVQTQADEIRDTFAFLDDWEARYEHIIDLGKSLPAMSADDMQDVYKVPGCASQVWLHPTVENRVMQFDGDSDAMIVRGLIALLRKLYNGLTLEAVLAVDAKAEMERLGLNEHLSSQRSNGLKSMIERIRLVASQG